MKPVALAENASDKASIMLPEWINASPIMESMPTHCQVMALAKVLRGVSN